jgi:drug/metabolite transporter (DMT)-like permease
LTAPPEPLTPPPAAGDKLQAVGAMVMAVASLSCMDALGKRVAAEYSVFQMLAIRSTIALAILTAWLAARGQLTVLHTSQLGGHALRSVCGLVAFVSFYAALRHLPLADAVAVAFGSPFLVTALARVILKEPVGARRWIAIAVGFLGMLIIVRPGADAFRPATLLVLLSALSYALLMLLARGMTRPGRPHESTFAFVFYMLAGQAAAGWLVTIRTWRAPEAAALAEMAAMGVLAILGNYGLAYAFRTAPVATVAPFEYTGLIWAVVLGAVLFGDFPTTSFWVGAAVIIWAGVYTLRTDSA